MTYASLLTLATGAHDDALAIELGGALAARHGAVLRVLPAAPYIAASAWVGDFSGSMVSGELAEIMVRTQAEFVAATQARVQAMAADKGLDFGEGETGKRAQMAEAGILPWEALSRECPLADLTVIGQSAVEGEGPWTGLLGQALMEARTPVLIARQGQAADTGAAIVAWNGTLEAGRAVRAAMPLLTLASRVIVAQSIEGEALESDRPDASQLAAYLRRAGVHEVSLWRRQSHRPAEDLITLSRELSVSLLVSGAFGHSRLRETFLGGVTQSLLREAHGCDLLIAH